MTLRQAADEWLRYEEHEAQGQALDGHGLPQLRRPPLPGARRPSARGHHDPGDRALEVLIPGRAPARRRHRPKDAALTADDPQVPDQPQRDLPPRPGGLRHQRQPRDRRQAPRPDQSRQTLESNDFLEPAEVHALIAAADDDTDAAIFATAAFCGLRLGELLALRWRAIDFQRSLISVEASFTRGREGTPKSGDGRTVPMAPEVAAALMRLRERPYLLGPRDLVFLGRGASHVDPNSLRKRFHEALEQAGLPRVRLHDLRHTFGTIMVSRVDPRTLQHWMGHGSIEVTEMCMAFRDKAEDAAKVSDAFRVA